MLEIEDLKAENERLKKALAYEQWLDGRQGTHGEGCWSWGPAHYRCALRHIEEITNNPVLDKPQQ